MRQRKPGQRGWASQACHPPAEGRARTGPGASPPRRRAAGWPARLAGPRAWGRRRPARGPRRSGTCSPPGVSRTGGRGSS
eukprot:11346041-Alexandrium_andersonii.AAC.1